MSENILATDDHGTLPGIQYDEIEGLGPDEDDTASRIKNSQYLTSYNWLGVLDARCGIIFVGTKTFNFIVLDCDNDIS
jgi:hypothetical protein